MAYAAIPSVLLLGSTRHIGDEIASFPLLWIVPLTLYLATFIVAGVEWVEVAAVAGGCGVTVVHASHASWGE